MGQTTPFEYQAPKLRYPGVLLCPQAELLFSSRSLAWNGVVVEVFRVREVNISLEYSEHVVTLLLKGVVNILQRRNGYVSQRVMHAGEIVVAPAGGPKLVQHREQAEIMRLHLTTSLLDRIVEDTTAMPRGSVVLLDNFGTRDEHIDALGRRLLAEAKSQGFASRIYVDSLTNQLAIHLLRHYSSAAKSAKGPVAGLPRCKLQRATDYINDHLLENLTLDRISKMLSMSSYHFAHAFKQTTGLAPHRYVIERRMERAKTLLRETELSIAQIAHQVGYANQSHFSVVFHRFFGQTPRRFRLDQ